MELGDEMRRIASLAQQLAAEIVYLPPESQAAIIDFFNAELPKAADTRLKIESLVSEELSSGRDVPSASTIKAYLDWAGGQ